MPPILNSAAAVVSTPAFSLDLGMTLTPEDWHEARWPRLEAVARRRQTVTMFVFDCSVAAAFLFEDEASPPTEALLARLEVEGAIVPSPWSLELGNMLVQAERRHRTRSTQLPGILDLVRRLPIVTDSETGERALREIFALARQEGLTTYDASCLELAMRHNVDLATRPLPGLGVESQMASTRSDAIGVPTAAGSRMSNCSMFSSGAA